MKQSLRESLCLKSGLGWVHVVVGVGEAACIRSGGRESKGGGTSFDLYIYYIQATCCGSTTILGSQDR